MWIDSVVGWYAPTKGTSDYFNVCNTTLNSVPNSTAVGYQYAYDGVGYCGFLAYASDFTQNDKMWCEYIQSQLIQPLEANKRYKFSMRINRANDYNLAVQKIGANFSQFPNTDFSVTRPFNILPTVLNNTSFITDTLGWTLVSGQFTATGIENFLTIGWFGDTITSDYLFFIPPYIDPITGDSLYLTETYYTVDSLKLYELKYDIEDFNVNVITPNNDNVNDIIDFSVYNFGELNFVILNRWGNVVWQTNDPNSTWDGKTSTDENISDGTYFYRLYGFDFNGKEINKNGIVQVVR